MDSAAARRDGVDVQLHHPAIRESLGDDLTQSEADRLAAFIKALPWGTDAD